MACRGPIKGERSHLVFLHIYKPLDRTIPGRIFLEKKEVWINSMLSSVCYTRSHAISRNAYQTNARGPNAFWRGGDAHTRRGRRRSSQYKRYFNGSRELHLRMRCWACPAGHRNGFEAL